MFKILNNNSLKQKKYICQERFLIKIELFNVSLKAKICLDDIFLGMDIKRIRERQKGARVLRSRNNVQECVCFMW